MLVGSFIAPASPALRAAPPTDAGWLHEVKFDGWRVQLHKAGASVVIYSRQGRDLTDRFPHVVAAVRHLRNDSLIIDAELVALRPDGSDNFYGVTRRDSTLRCWAFDLLALAGKDLRPLPLSERRRQLIKVLDRAEPSLRLSETFDDPLVLLAELERRGIEGIVSKRATSPYRSGARCGWIKVKTESWRTTNRGRWEKFQKL